MTIFFIGCFVGGVAGIILGVFVMAKLEPKDKREAWTDGYAAGVEDQAAGMTPAVRERRKSVPPRPMSHTVHMWDGSWRPATREEMELAATNAREFSAERNH